MYQPVEKLPHSSIMNPNNMRISALEQLADRGVVVIQKKGSEYVVECIRKDEAGFLTDRQTVWGKSLQWVIDELVEKVTNAE